MFPGYRHIPKPVRERLKQVPHLRDWVHDVDILLKHGKLRPQTVELANSPHRIYIDAEEPRGRAVLRGRGRGQGEPKRVFRRCLALMSPTLVLDIGANYGEFAFASDYPQNCQVLVVEPNPVLGHLLEQSRRLHPDADRITVERAAAGARSEGELVIYIDEEWSGRSSAVRAEGKPVHVPMLAVDEWVAAHQASPARVLFKVDVEGYEPFVLEGMKKTLASADTYAGFVEFNTDFMEMAGVDKANFLDEIAGLGAVFVFSRKGIQPLDEVRSQVEHKAIADLFVCSDAALLQHIPLLASG